MRWARAALRAAWHRTASANLLVTRRCDLTCGYCHVYGQGHAEISPVEWLEIARRLSRRYAVFTVTGGEPLLYKGLPELVAGLEKLGLVGLCSNVRTLSEAHLKEMPGLDYLNFSIDGTHASPGSPKFAYDKFELMREYARRNGFRLFGTAVVTARTLDGIPDVVRRLAAERIPINIQLVQDPAPEDAFDTPTKRAALGALQRELLAMKRSGYPIAEPDDYLDGFVAFVEGRAAVPCHAGETYLAVDTDGRPKPCHAVGATGSSLIDGDIRVSLEALPEAVPDGCHCWWNCHHWYGDWRRSPLAYVYGHLRDSLRTRRHAVGKGVAG